VPESTSRFNINNSYSLQNRSIIRVVKSRRLRRARYAALMGTDEKLIQYIGRKT
jgi:hypothetical protein